MWKTHILTNYRGIFSIARLKVKMYLLEPKKKYFAINIHAYYKTFKAYL